MSLDPLFVWMAVAGMAVLFAHAALSKLTDLPLFEQHLAAYGLPAPLLPVLTRALPALEGLAAVLLLTPWREVGAVLAAGLLLAYGAAMAWHRGAGRRLDCGCGGEPLPLSWALVIRNAALAAWALAAAAPMAPRLLALADFFLIAASLVVSLLLYAALHQLLRHRAHISARLTPSRKGY